MKKLNKGKVEKLIKSKNYTYKELAKITGYHEKSLIRLSSQIQMNIFSVVHGNKNRHPHNYIDDKEKNNLIMLWNQKDYKTYKEFYYALNAKYSYSFLCKLLPQKKKKKDNFIIRKAIQDNVIQYQNKRYRILNGNIKHHEKISLNVNELYVLYKEKKYDIKVERQLNSKKGTTKYF